MKFEEPKNKNYCATVVKINNIIPLENCDNVVATSIFGFQAIVGKDTVIGQMGIFFPAETQLSDDFCRENNMYRHDDKNRTLGVKGYIEDSRRVKAVKFRGNISNGLFMPLHSLKYLGVSAKDFNDGDIFDSIKGKEVCRKYVIREPKLRGNHQPQPKRFNRVDTKFIPEHFDTENYFRNDRNVAPEEVIIVTQKLHGTSVRIANTVVLRRLTLSERIAKFFGVKIQETEMDYVYGSRKVIKDIHNPYHNHFYSSDIWTSEGEKLKGMIPENFIVYGELIGYTPDGKALQADYTYHVEAKKAELYIYRIAFVNSQGLVTDIEWDRVKIFCKERGLKHEPEIWRGPHSQFNPHDYIEKRLSEFHDVCLPLSAEGVDEGVCIRVERMIPYILKAKSPTFLEHESKMLDKGDVDLESQESTPILEGTSETTNA